MLLAALILQAAGPQSAVEAERTFAAAAQVEGQWTAARRFAAPDAQVLSPLPVPVGEAYGGPDPVPAYQWWVSDSFLSCDGRTAVNTGPWEREGAHGWFTTVWQRQDDGSWKWILDSGDQLRAPRPRPVEVRVRQADCASAPGPAPSASGNQVARAQGGAAAKDRSLIWSWTVDKDGNARLSVSLWSGAGYVRVLEDLSPPAK